MVLKQLILQAHDSSIRAMEWSKQDDWLISGDNRGLIKYWQLNLHNVKTFLAHKENSCRSLSLVILT